MTTDSGEINIGVLGLGAIGTPLAYNLWKYYGNRVTILTDRLHEKRLRTEKIVNGKSFTPQIFVYSEKNSLKIDLLILCVKNYDIDSLIEPLSNIICSNTIIMPLQNGIYSYDILKEKFTNNMVLECYAQGVDTTIIENNIIYTNPGEYHIGSSFIEESLMAKKVYELLSKADVFCVWEDNIQHAIWKKLMLNVAGNAMTALTGATYDLIKESYDAQIIIRVVMEEYTQVVKGIGVNISNSDKEEVMKYFMTYVGQKHTSMLDDVINKRSTENEYIAGVIIRLAKEQKIKIPSIEMLYHLINVKEKTYD